MKVLGQFSLVLVVLMSLLATLLLPSVEGVCGQPGDISGTGCTLPKGPSQPATMKTPPPGPRYSMPPGGIPKVFA